MRASYGQAKHRMPEINTQRLENFVARFTRLIESLPKEAALLTQGREILHDLVKQDDWLEAALRQPHDAHYQQYLLHLDPKERFSVVSFVWGPGQFTPIHDHTVWGLIGMLEGSEKCQPYSRMSDGRWVPAGLQLQLLPGDVEAVSPRLGDVHKVWNTFSDQTSISIHVYGGNIGRIPRHVYQLDGQMKEFVSGYSPVPSLGSFQEHSPRTPHASASNKTAPVLANPPISKTVPLTLEAAHATPAPASAVKSWMSRKAIDQLSPAQAKTSSMGKGLLQDGAAGFSSAMTPSGVPGFLPHAKVVLGDDGLERAPLSRSGSSATNTATATATATSTDTNANANANVHHPEQTLGALSGSGLSIRPRADVVIPSIASSASNGMKPSQPSQPSQPLMKSIAPSLAQSLTQGPIQAPSWVSGLAHVQAQTQSPSPSTKPQIQTGSSTITPDDASRKSAMWVRERLLARQEVALIDLREEDPFARGHPLFAAQMSLSRVELDAYRRLPCLESPIVLYHDEESVAERVREILQQMGYKAVFLLQNGLRAWQQARQEMFIDVNVPSKAFGEMVAAQKHTPHVSATQLKFWLDQNADLVVLDARRFDEYQTMSIPKGISVPGAELALRARTLAPRVTTRIVVNCAGRTRSIIGAQSLLNAGIPNPVCALENGTIGWVLAGQTLESGRTQTFGDVNEADLSKAKMSALALAIRSGVKRIDLQELQALSAEVSRTTYLFDVRSAREFEEGHLPKAIHAPGGQLVQETDHFAPVRGARLVLYDTEGVRAMMSASWLAQMAWEVYVIKDVRAGDLTRKDTRYIDPPQVSGGFAEVTPESLKEWLAQRNNLTLVVDISSSAHYVKRHIPGAWWLLRSQMKHDFSRVHKANRYVLTSEDGLSARFAWQELRSCVKPNVEIYVLVGGTQAWVDLGYSVQVGESYLASPRIDRYQRPYEGVENSAPAMQAYLDWEFGLVEQLRKDGTHHFRVV